MLGARADAAVVARLLAAGANPNQVSGGGNSALMEAAYPGNLAVVSMLLRAGANPNHTNQFQESALLVGSMSRGNVATIQALLDAGADPSQRDCDDVSAADLAKKHSNLPVYNLLTSRGGDVLHIGA
jgi:ankyrin repeat protein